VARLLLANPDVEVNQTAADGQSALYAASQRGHGAIVSLLVAHHAHGQVRLLAADAIDSLPADLFKELPGVAAQAAALRLTLDVAAALGDTEEERAAPDALASQSASFTAAKVQLAAAAEQNPIEFVLAREALVRAPAQSPSDAAEHAARELEADAALRAATTTTAFRLAQARQLVVRKTLFSRCDALVRGASVGRGSRSSSSRRQRVRRGSRCATQWPGAGGPPTRRDSSSRRRHHGAGRRARRARQARARHGKDRRRHCYRLYLARCVFRRCSPAPNSGWRRLQVGRGLSRRSAAAFNIYHSATIDCAFNPTVNASSYLPPPSLFSPVAAIRRILAALHRKLEVRSPSWKGSLSHGEIPFARHTTLRSRSRAVPVAARPAKLHCQYKIRLPAACCAPCMPTMPAPDKAQRKEGRRSS
jgi:hypothetical protein